MLRKALFNVYVFCVLVSPVFCMAADAPINGPSAFISDGVFEFLPVVEGSEVVHQFILLNRGDAPLEILDIKSG